VIKYTAWFLQKGSVILDSLIKLNHQGLAVDLEAKQRWWFSG